MAGKKTAVYGIYHGIAQAERSVDHLIAAGFSNDDISVLLPDFQGSKEFAHKKDTKAPEGTTTRVAALSGVIGGDSRIARGRWRSRDPREWVRLSRPVQSWAPSPVWESAAQLGDWSARSIGMGIPEYEAKRYEGRIKEGGAASFRFDFTRHIRRNRSRKRSAKADGRGRYFRSSGEAHADYPASGEVRELAGKMSCRGRWLGGLPTHWFSCSASLRRSALDQLQIQIVEIAYPAPCESRRGPPARLRS